jgi:uncharacterized protein YndB with AHSA1/START domain
MQGDRRMIAPSRFCTEPGAFCKEQVEPICPGSRVAVAVVLLLAAIKPDTFSVRRVITVKAPPDKIFPLINDFHQWGNWSPYETKDPAMKRSYSGAASGKGAVYGWDGNNKVGSGRMEILDASVPEKIVIKLDFARPFEGHNTAEFTMLPQGNATKVTWLMHGSVPFIGKVMHLFMNIDKMVGKDFEIGLANLKELTEK